MVWNHIAIIGKLLVTERAPATLNSNFSVHQPPHLCVGPEFDNLAHPKDEISRCGRMLDLKLTSRIVFSTAEKLGCLCAITVPETANPVSNTAGRTTNVEWSSFILPAILDRGEASIGYKDQ